MNRRFVLKIGGESGQGVNSIGEILAKALKNSGYFIFGYREYPSLIRGGVASYQLDFSAKSLLASSSSWHVLICLSRRSIHEYLRGLKNGGVLIHDLKNMRLDKVEREFVDANNIRVIFIDTKSILRDMGASNVMANSILLGMVWNVLGLGIDSLKVEVEDKFKHKSELLPMNFKLLDLGYEREEIKDVKIGNNLDQNLELINSMVISGNESLSLGAVNCGVRALYAYPMTPASSILSYLASIYKKTGMLVKQVEDEITAAQMTIGSMYSGTRALTATSGGGFDLMSESLSLAAIAEVPFVCVIAQRPGPATGVPTWTAAGDLNLALYSGHGEYIRCVVAISDAISGFHLIQEAYDIAEFFQIPVLVLTEKQIAESLYNVDSLESKLEVKRYLVESDFENLKSEDRYKDSDSGVSPRWLPGDSSATYLANSDEHREDGALTEDAKEVKSMVDKRMRKLESLRNYLKEPVLFGESSGRILIIGWGSAKGTVLDALGELDSGVSYLHFEYLYPLNTEVFNGIRDNFKKIVLIENNYMGQFGNLMKLETGISFDSKFLKYDGRPFFVEEVVEFIESLK